MEEIYKLLQKNNFSFTADSRMVKPGDVFFALKGDNFNGNDFLDDVVSHGASYIVCNDKRFAEMNPDVLYVDDTVQFLGELAAHHRNKFSIPVLALTGSNGKTTTKEMLRSVLSQKFNVVATEGNLNNHLGLPYTLLAIRDTTELVVVEMGANHVGEIKYLCEIARPTHGLITNIGLAHVGEFGGVEGIQRAKGELFDFLKSNEGIVFADCGDETIMEMVSSRHIDPVCYVENAVMPENLFGEYNTQNTRSATSVGRFFGVPEIDIEHALRNFKPAHHRSNIVHTSKGNTVIADMYNANPTSMEKALISFKNFQKENQHKIVIIGDMLELGAYAEEEHEKIVDLVQQLGFPEVIFVGPVFSACPHIFGKVFPNVGEAIDFLKKENIQNSLCFVKASNGTGLKSLIEQDIL